MDTRAIIRALEHYEPGDDRLAVFLALWDKLTGSDQLLLAVAIRREDWYPDLQERMYRVSCTTKRELVERGQDLMNQNG